MATFGGDHRVLLAWGDERHNLYKQRLKRSRTTKLPPESAAMRSRSVQMSTHMTLREAVPLTSLECVDVEFFTSIHPFS